MTAIDDRLAQAHRRYRASVVAFAGTAAVALFTLVIIAGFSLVRIDKIGAANNEQLKIIKTNQTARTNQLSYLQLLLAQLDANVRAEIVAAQQSLATARPSPLTTFPATVHKISPSSTVLPPLPEAEPSPTPTLSHVPQSAPKPTLAPIPTPTVAPSIVLQATPTLPQLVPGVTHTGYLAMRPSCLRGDALIQLPC